MRFKIVKIIYFSSVLLIVARLFYWQVIRFDDLTAKAEGQRLSTRTILAPRGSILFSDGSFLASSEPRYLVYAQPKLIKDKIETAKKLSNIFYDLEPLNGESIDEKLVKEKKEILEMQVLEKLSKDLFWVSLGKKVNSDFKERIEQLKIVGLGFDTSLARFYPEGSSSAHLLGFVGADVYGRDTGYFGLEGYYDGDLRGKDGVLTQDKDAHGLPIIIGTYNNKEAKQGKTIVLNIDRTIQFIVERSLKKGIEKYGAKGASAIVMEPKTGNVLALVAFPSYDPGRPGVYPKQFYKNPLTVDGYEPGSTFKVLVMAAGLNEGLIKPDTVCDICSGPLNVGGFTIRTWNNKYNAKATMADVIIHSDNTGMVYVAKKLGIDKMYEYIKKFGFGDLTGIDLQDEYSPALREKEAWKEIDLATSSFGQGISVTGLQIVRATAAIANGGVLMEPHVVSKIYDNQKVYTITPKETSRPITPETAKMVTEMMVRAVEEGEAKYLKPKDFKVAGKTGTAQIPVAGHYDPTKTIASFVGFAPAENPRFVMLVRYDQPTSSIYGAETAAPTFFEVAREIFTYLGIFPSSL